MVESVVYHSSKELLSAGGSPDCVTPYVELPS